MPPRHTRARRGDGRRALAARRLRNIEHHLFPSMPRPNLRRSQALVRAFCRRHGISYHAATNDRSATSSRTMRRVGGALVGRTVARTGLAPIDRLTAAAVRVAHTQDLDAHIPDEGGGEIRRLIQSINDMLAALRDSRRRAGPG